MLFKLSGYNSCELYFVMMGFYFIIYVPTRTGTKVQLNRCSLYQSEVLKWSLIISLFSVQLLKDCMVITASFELFKSLGPAAARTKVKNGTWLCLLLPDSRLFPKYYSSCAPES